MNIKAFFAGLVVVFGLAASPASAALVLGPTACANTDIGPTASACVGWYKGNLNNGSPAGLNGQVAAINALLGTSYDVVSLPILETLPSISGNTVDFGTTLFGETVVSFHVGAAKGQASGVGYNATAFYVFDAGTSGLDTFDFNRAGLSNARLYTTGLPAVPEPGTWALMIMGFGMMGAAMRRRRKTSANLGLA